MGGFYTGSEDAEVENLLNQLEEESVLKLKVNSHRTTTGIKGPSSSGANVVGDDDGLDHELLARFANLKSRPAVGKEKTSRSGGESAAKNHKTGGSSLEQVNDVNDGEKDDDVSELEMRLNALKAQESLPKKSSSPSPKPSKPSKSFSPMKLVKQLSMGKKKKKAGSDGSVPHSMSDVDKLLASAADELALEKKNGSRGKLEADDEDVDDEDEDLDEDDDLDDKLLKDLNVKLLKKELTVASLEEDRLSREAQKVIEWAKDAARLESSTSVKGEDSDLEELLKAEEAEKVNTSAKKKKGKKWSLF